MIFQNDKTKLGIIILSILAVIVIVTSFLNANKSEKLEEAKIVDNYTNFYTVNSCLYRTITYISGKDENSLLSVLDDKYKSKNNINANNILSSFQTIEEDSTFVSKKMYYQEMKNDIVKYYVYGVIEKNGLYENGAVDENNTKDIYFIVYIDNTNGLFSIEPYSGELFKGGSVNE